MTNEEKQKHIDAFKYWCETNEECGVITIPKFVCDNIIEILDNAPTVEARPKGEWEYVGMGIYECTNCKAEYEAGLADHCNINNSEFKYCPNCGADMRGNV